MSNNPAKYEVLIKQYLRATLDISVRRYSWELMLSNFQIVACVFNNYPAKSRGISSDT